MELHLKTQNESNCMKKYLYNLKTQRSDGLILKISHSCSDSLGKTRKYRFIQTAFNDSGTGIALSDHRGNIFIIDLEMQKHWPLPYFGSTTLISFIVSKKQELLVGLDTGSIIICHTATGEIINTLNGHTIPAIEASFTDSGCYCLTFCVTEAIIWDLLSNSQVHKLTLKPEASLKKVVFMPVTHNILACFQDDTLSVWHFRTFECIKQIIPESWKTYHLRDVALTKDGRAMVIGGHSPNLVIFCLDTWTIKKVIEFPENVSGIKQLQFIPQVFDGGANKVLAILTTSLEIYFFDIETSTFLSGMHLIFGITSKMAVSNNGKYLATIFTTGEVNIYTLQKTLQMKQISGDLCDSKNTPKIDSNLPNGSYSVRSRRIQKSNESLNGIKTQLNEILDLKRIQPILKQFGEYPELYRALIWKTILKLPGNQNAFCCLSTKECHPSYSNLQLKYPLVNKSLNNALKKLLSNLSYWCPLFGEVNFMPEFVFPFVKLFHSDPLGCFEAIATIIVNWCQNWFEFYPFPPINLLSALENILGYHDPELLQYYLETDITSSVSMCPLFHTAFSEVLSKEEWLKLWDHVLSNEPSFLFLAIVAYNTICRNAIRSLKNTEDIEKFFHSQNPIDVRKLISKTYFYQRETPDEIHCRRFFSPFRPLTSGTYSSFSAYPKLIVDSSVEKLHNIRKEEEEILQEQMKALTIKQKLEKRLKTEDQVAGEERIYRELEDQIRKVVEEEEDRLLNQRQKLRNLKQELRLKELQVLEDTRDKALREKKRRKELELERLIHDISKRKARENSEVEIMEEEIRKYYAQLLLKKYQLELDLDVIGRNDDLQVNLERQRESLKKDLGGLHSECNSMSGGKGIEVEEKMISIKRLIDDLEAQLAKDLAEKESKNVEAVELTKLKLKVKALEEQIEKLLTENLLRIHEEQGRIGPTLPLREKYATPRTPSLKSTKKSRLKKPNNEKIKTITVTTSNKISSPVAKEKINIEATSSFNENQYDLKEDQRTTRPKLKSKLTCRRRRSEPHHVRYEKMTNAQHNSALNGGEELRESISKTDEKCVHRNKCEMGNKNCSKIGSDYSFISDSENEIFRLALKTRKQLIEEARRRQNMNKQLFPNC